MSDYRDRRKAKQLAKRLARLHAYDLDPSPYGSWIVVPPRKHATRTEKQRWLQSSRAVNGKVVAIV